MHLLQRGDRSAVSDKKMCGPLPLLLQDYRPARRASDLGYKPTLRGWDSRVSHDALKRAFCNEQRRVFLESIVRDLGGKVQDIARKELSPNVRRWTSSPKPPGTGFSRLWKKLTPTFARSAARGIIDFAFPGCLTTNSLLASPYMFPILPLQLAINKAAALVSSGP